MQKVEVQNQFKKRADTYNISANWITDKNLIKAHVNAAGIFNGRGLELCCGTGIIGRTLVSYGWRMTGIDITNEMVCEAQKYFPTIKGDVEKLPFKNDSFDLVIMRQALLFLNTSKTFGEVLRVLKAGGTFVLSQTVPFSDRDKDWLKKIHITKQAQLLRFYTDTNLEKELIENSFRIDNKYYLTVRESITKWLNHAPELSNKKKEEIHKLILEAPEEYKKIRNVRILDGKLWEDWNWVIFKAKPNI